MVKATHKGKPGPTKTNNMKIEVSNLTVELCATFVEGGVSFPNNDESNNSHNQFEVTAKVDGENLTFDFYRSQNDHYLGKKELNDSDLMGAFECFLSDATAGANEDFEDFCNELGYDNDSIKALNIFKTCKESFNDLDSILPAGTDVSDMSNDMQEAIEKYDSYLDEDAIIARFESEVLPSVVEAYEQDGIIDVPARREEFNNFTDMLCKNDEISDDMYNNICIPDRLEK